MEKPPEKSMKSVVSGGNNEKIIADFMGKIKGGNS